MKNLFKMGMALLIVAMLFVVGCEIDKGNGGDNNTSGIDFTSYSGQNASILFRNSTNNRVIAFKSNILEENIIGGIPGNTSLHGIKNDPAFFNSTSAFMVYILTEAQWNAANKTDFVALEKLEQAPLTKFYVFYNTNGTNDTLYEISSFLGGTEYKIVIQMPTNNSAFNAELRVNGTTGRALGYAQAGSFQTELYIQPNVEFNLFPVFHRYNTVRDILEAVYPVNQVTKYAIQYDIALGGDNGKERVIPLGPVLTAAQTNPTTFGVAYIIFENHTTGASMLQITQGQQPVRNSLGISLFSTSLTYQLNMSRIAVGNPAMGGTESFSPSVTFGNFGVGLTGQSRPITPKSGGSETNHTLYDGQVYKVEVFGDQVNELLVATIDLDGSYPIVW